MQVQSSTLELFCSAGLGLHLTICMSNKGAWMMVPLEPGSLREY